MARPRPTTFDTSWQPGALALLRLMTPSGQEQALRDWAKLGFTPTLSACGSATLSEASLLLADFTVLDLEFQGTDLLELAAIRYQHWQPVGQYASFVRFRGELGYHVTTLTGITRGDVYHAPEEKAVLQGFFKLAGDSVLVCHNIGADRRILETARTRQGAAAPLANRWLCTLALAKLRLPPKTKCGLGELCTAFGIAAHGAHRALRDVEMTFQVLRHLQRQAPITELVTSAAKPRNAGQAVLFAAA
jgi:DNA polymerase III alpha subunit (gram-positive type)